jgi:hypothetical protein
MCTLAWERVHCDRRKRGRYKKQSITTLGRIRSLGMGVELAGQNGNLAVRLTGDDSTRQDLPLD